MCETVAEVRAHALALLLGGASPEEVEGRLGKPGCILDPLTALSDPTNVLMEVVDDGTAEGTG